MDVGQNTITGYQLGSKMKEASCIKNNKNN